MANATERRAGEWAGDRRLVSVLGTQSVTFGVPILMEEVAKFNDAADAAKGETNARS
jgi:hypothetical protein